MGVQARIVRIFQGVERLASAVGIVAQGLHAVAGFRPGPLQFDAGLLQQDGGTAANPDVLVGQGSADDVAAQVQSYFPQATQHGGRRVGLHLDHRPQFLVEQGRQGVAGQRFEVDVQAAVGGESISHRVASRPPSARSW